MQTFNVIDVETANADRSSICQIGIVHVRNGEIAGRWKTLVDPRSPFDPYNIKVHGIAESDVKGSPIIPDLSDELRERLDGSILVSHTSFDRIAMQRVMDRYGLDHLRVTWLDSTIIVRRTWPEKYGRRGFGLKNVAADIGISFMHHDALEDAEAAARIVLHAYEFNGKSIDEWANEIAWRPRAEARTHSRRAFQTGSIRQEDISRMAGRRNRLVHWCTRILYKRSGT